LSAFGTRPGLASSFKCSNVEHDLPALKFGDFAERGHAAFCVAIGDFPEKSTVAFLLDDGKLQISRVFLFEASAIPAVALGAIADE
jgi:hypothetical protein